MYFFTNKYLSVAFSTKDTWLLNSLPTNKIPHWSKLKEFADNNFNLDENGKMFSKRAENTVGKGEIACYDQFLLFPQCFQKTCAADMYRRLVLQSCD